MMLSLDSMLEGGSRGARMLQKDRGYDMLKKAEVYLVHKMGLDTVNSDGRWAFYRMNNALATQPKWWISCQLLFSLCINRYRLVRYN